jgi:hypothetical protein
MRDQKSSEDNFNFSLGSLPYFGSVLRTFGLDDEPSKQRSAR